MNETSVENTFENIKARNEIFDPAGSSINFKITLFAILPLILAQIVQRFYPIIDNHYIATLGTQALLIHNIQYSFINLGQYIGSATAVSCLIFWKRSDYVDKQSSVFYIHIGLCLAISVICMLIASHYSSNILKHFSVQTEYYPVAIRYFHFGLCNMVLQAIYLVFIGVVIATNKEKLSFIFSAALLIFNIIVDSIAIRVFFSGEILPSRIATPMYAIILSNMTLVVVCLGIMFYILKEKISHLNFSKFKEIFKIWTNELGGAFISGIYPIVYIFQLGLLKTNSSFIITYQLLMQLTAVFCIPILATMQVSIRDASAMQGQPQSKNIPIWVRELIYFGLIPTEILLCIFTFFPVLLIQFVFGYRTPADHVSYIIIYLIASIIGQIGNALTVPIRARKNSHLVTTSYFISDVIILVGGTQLLLVADFANPTTAGLVMLIYTCVYTAINAYFAIRK